MEGVQFKWADAALDNADKIVVLDLPRWRNTLRIVRRFLSRRRFSKPSPRATWAALGQEMRWSRDYYDHERALLFEKLGRYEEKVIKVRDDHALRETFEGIISMTAIETRRACTTENGTQADV